MRDVMFAWIFTVVVWCVLPYAQISRLETVIAVTYFFIVGLYIYAVIERNVRRNRRRKLRRKTRIKEEERRVA